MIIRSVAPNQTELERDDEIYFVSYETPVAAFVPGVGVLRESQSSSRTTARHINQFLERHGIADCTTLLVDREKIRERMEGVYVELEIGGDNE